MSSLVDLLNDSTPLSAPLGQLIVIAAVFFAAWLVGRAAGRIASFFVLRAERKHPASIEDTGVIASLKQRETALSLARTTSGNATIYGLTDSGQLFSWGLVSGRDSAGGPAGCGGGS